jgi:predicted Zn-dependent protease
MSRLDQLRQLLEKDPNDPFLRYGIAMEHMKAQRRAEALAEFSTLLREHPDYVAGYFMAGRTHEQAGDIPAARKMYEEGIAAARRTGDLHAAGEIGDAMAAL